MPLPPRVITTMIVASITGLLSSPLAVDEPRGSLPAPVECSTLSTETDAADLPGGAAPIQEALTDGPAGEDAPSEDTPSEEAPIEDPASVDVIDSPTAAADTAYLRRGQSANVTATFQHVEHRTDATITTPAGVVITQIPSGWRQTPSGITGSVHGETRVTFTVMAQFSAVVGIHSAALLLGAERIGDWTVVVQGLPGPLASAKQTSEPSVVPRGTGRIGVTLDNSGNTDISTNARFTLLAPEAATFTESRIWYGPGQYFDGTLSADRTRMTLDLRGFAIATNSRMTLEVAVLAPTTPTHAGVHGGGALVFESGSLLPAGSRVPLQYRIPSQVAAPVQADRPELRSGETGSVSVSLDNTLGFAINGTAEMTFTAPAEATFVNSHYTWHLDGDSGPKDGRLSADKRTLTVSTDGFRVPARKTMQLSINILADVVAGEGERAGGGLTFMNDAVVATGTVVPLAYDRVSTEVQIRPLVVEEPAIGGEFTVGANGKARPEFSGTATPGATISIRTAWLNDPGSTIADPITGRWSITWKEALLPAEYSGGYTTQTFRDAVVDRVGYRFSVVKNDAIRPLIVTAPGAGGTIPVDPGGDVAPVFSGTASPGATISIITAWQEPVGSTTADPSGAWSITWDKRLRPGDYVGGKTTQVLDGVKLDSVVYDFTVVR